MPSPIAVIIPTDRTTTPQLKAMLDGLRAQTYAAWEAVFVGAHPAIEPGFDPRVKMLRANGGRLELIRRAVSTCGTPHVLVCEPEDRLLPGALSALSRASGQGGPGVIAGFTAECGIGTLPGDRLPNWGGDVGWAELVGCSVPSCAMLLRRDSFESLAVSTPAWDLELQLRLTEAGARFARVPDCVAAYRMRELMSHEDACRWMFARLRAICESAERRNTPAMIESSTSDLVDALTLLRTHAQTVGAHGTRHLEEAVRFPASFPQWWQRLGFHGLPPRHVLSANGGVIESVAQSPELIASRMADSLGESGSPILLGLGKNARFIARELHRRGIAVKGRDDSLGTPPAWAAEDAIPVELIPASTPLNPTATYLMTVLNDANFLSRLPRGLTIVRWSEIPALIVREGRERILAHVMAGDLVETTS